MRHTAPVLLISLSIVAVASAQTNSPVIPQSNIVYSIRVHDGRAIAGIPHMLPPESFQEAPFESDPAPVPLAPSRGKIVPELEFLVATRSPKEMYKILIGFRDDLSFPRFPDPILSEAMDSPGNIAAKEQAAQLIGQIQLERDRNFNEHIPSLGANVTVLERFWITSTLLVRIPLSEVEQVAALPAVATLEPEVSTVPPPSCCEVDDGRIYIGSDFSPDIYGGGSLALLDTGVRETHTQLSGRIGVMRDCVTGTSSGCTGGKQEPSDSCNHGTSSAAIIAANSSQGSQYRGVTVATVNSYKVYGNGCLLNRSAVQRAFQAALANLDKVIVAEMQDNTGESGTTTVAGDNAFDAGALVIAANGNQGAVTAPGGPANGHKVLGAGARSLPYDVTVYQVNGPTSDGRIKPDVQVPTDTQTASSASDTALRYFAGTSGSTPYLGGAALIHRNELLFALGANSVDPGQVYALLIADGRQPAMNNIEGAGPIKINRFAWRFFGSLSLTSGQQVDVPIFVCGSNFWILEGAIWWPEAASVAHRRLELSLVDPSGVVRATSSHATSIFQKVEMNSGIVHGTWKLRIKAISIFSGSQQIYWSSGFNGQLTCGFP